MAANRLSTSSFRREIWLSRTYVSRSECTPSDNPGPGAIAVPQVAGTVSFSNEQAAVASEARILAQHTRYRQQLLAFMETMAGNATADAKRAGFYVALGHSTDFANLCEQSIGDASLLGATKNEAWAKNKAETSLNALDMILRAHQTFVAVAQQLSLPVEAVHPSPTAYASLQRHVALFFPEQAERIRIEYEKEGLPVSGFNDGAPQSPARKELSSLLAEWRPELRILRERAETAPNHSIETDSLADQLLGLESEGARLIVQHATWLAERWAKCGSHRQRENNANDDMVPRLVPIRDVASEVSQRIAILELVEKAIRENEAAPNTQNPFFHVLASFDTGEPAIANDLTKDTLLSTVVMPLLANKSIRLDGHLVEPGHPRIKISRTEHNCAHYIRELELRQKRSGHIDFSIRHRQLPLDHGLDVTTELLGSLESRVSSGDTVARIHGTIIWIVGILGLAAIGAGVVALVFDSRGATKLNLVGVGLDTSNVGVACIAIGLVIVWLAMRSVLRSMRDLAEIRANSAVGKSRRAKGSRES